MVVTLTIFQLFLLAVARMVEMPIIQVLGLLQLLFMVELGIIIQHILVVVQEEQEVLVANIR
jgi:hypothetical protein